MERNLCLVLQEYQAPRELESGITLPFTQFSLKEPTSEGWPGFCSACGHSLAPSLDKSLTEDKSLCPVIALRYYLDRTKDLRQGKDLVFVSFRKSFQKDIVPATISSWIKQTVFLCYQL